MFLTARGDVSVDVAPVEFFEIMFRTIPGVGRQFLSLSFRVLFDLRYYRCQLLLIRGIVGQRARHDDLAIGIDSRLRVVTLNNRHDFS